MVQARADMVAKLTNGRQLDTGTQQQKLNPTWGRLRLGRPSDCSYFSEVQNNARGRELRSFISTKINAS